MGGGGVWRWSLLGRARLAGLDPSVLSGIFHYQVGVVAFGPMT